MSFAVTPSYVILFTAHDQSGHTLLSQAAKVIDHVNADVVAFDVGLDPFGEPFHVDVAAVVSKNLVIAGIENLERVAEHLRREGLMPQDFVRDRIGDVGALIRRDRRTQVQVSGHVERGEVHPAGDDGDDCARAPSGFEREARPL